MMCNRCGNELPSDTPVCPVCGPVTLGGGFASSPPPPLPPRAAAPPLLIPPPSLPTSTTTATPPPPSSSPTDARDTKAAQRRARKERARAAMAARSSGETSQSADARSPGEASEAPPAVEDEMPLAAFSRPRPVTLIAGMDLLIGAARLVLAWAAFTGRGGLASGSGSIEFDGARVAISGLLLLVAAAGMWSLKPFGWYAQAANAALGFLSGFGSIVTAAMIFTYLVRPGVKVLFSGRDPATLSAQERARIRVHTPSPLLVPCAVALQGLLALGLLPALLAIRFS